MTAAEQAVDQGARLLLTPELSLCGYPPRDLLLNPVFIERMEEALHDLADRLPPQLAVLVGTVEPNPYAIERGGKPLYNSVAHLEHGQVQQRFHKRLLPTYDVFDENRYFEPGYESRILSVEQGQSQLRIGITICEDLWNDEEFWGQRFYADAPIEDLVQQNVDLVVNLSASPFNVGKQHLRESMLQHLCIRHQKPLIYVNQVGGNDDLIFDGHSVAFNSQGRIAGRVQGFESAQAVLTFDADSHDLMPAYIAPLAASEEAEIWSALVLGVRDYAHKCGFSKVVLGLSGGIDSSLVAAIATAALGPDNVLGILMPSPYSSDHSIGDALALAKNLGIATQTLPIQPLMEGFDHTLTPLFSGTQSGVAEENIQSRIRGTLLMAIANKFGYLLLSTGNKSEMAVGYCTLYGDMNGGLGAIADVPKTTVYALCRWLNTPTDPSISTSLNRYLSSGGDIIPEAVLSKAPSAELKPGQVDQDSLPPYEILDDILQRLIHNHQSVEQLIQAGHELETVEKVVKLVARSEFKRRQAPPGLKITDRAFGTGWRMPIASRFEVTKLK